MNHARVVRGRESSSDLSNHSNRLIDRNGTVGNPVGKGGTVDKFQNECLVIPAGLKTIDTTNVRMIERGKDFSFSLDSP